MGNGNGCIFAGPVRSFCGKVFTNGPVTRLRNRPRLGPTTSNNEIGAATITQRYEHWLSNGFALYSVAGKIGAYDESKYLAALAKRGSPLGKLVVIGIVTSL